MKLNTSILLCAIVLLGACSTLPGSGPTGAQVRKSALADPVRNLSIVEIDNAAALPPPPSAVEGDVMLDLPPPPTDMVGPGDVLGIYIYEAGVALVGNGPSPVSATGAAVVPEFGAKIQRLPDRRVSDDGDISIPYAGKMRVLGKTIGEIESQIRLALQGLSQDSQVIVIRREVISNAVIVAGEVVNPGRQVLQTNRETLSDVVALAGGYRGRSSELMLRISRAGRVSEMRLSELLAGEHPDIRAYPGDRLTLIAEPLTFSVLGAAGRLDQVRFKASTISLAQAIAMAGGSDNAKGDAAAIFVFRYVTDDRGQRSPMIYHLNMLKAGSYFLAQKFRMQNKDILYFGDAKANRPTKLVQFVGQLFSPVLTMTSAVSATQSSGN